LDYGRGENIVNKTGILLIHGFAGKVEDVAPLQDYLEERGYEVSCPLLSGHGSSKKALSDSTRQDWIDSAERAYLDLQQKYDDVVVIGFSMGGLLAFQLWNDKISGMITINAPFYYWNPKWIILNTVLDFKASVRKYGLAATDKTLSSMLEFLKLLIETKPLIQKISCRTLVIQALDDDTVHHKSAEAIIRRLRGEKSMYKVPRGGHMIFQSSSGEEVCRRIEEFLKEIEA